MLNIDIIMDKLVSPQYSFKKGTKVAQKIKVTKLILEYFLYAKILADIYIPA